MVYLIFHLSCFFTGPWHFSFINIAKTLTISQFTHCQHFPCRRYYSNGSEFISKPKLLICQHFKNWILHFVIPLTPNVSTTQQYISWNELWKFLEFIAISWNWRMATVCLFMPAKVHNLHNINTLFKTWERGLRL